MQPPKVTFKSQIGPPIKTYDVLCFCKISDGKSHWTEGFLKDLNRFFLSKPRKSKNALYYQKHLRFLWESDQKVSISVEKLKKMKPQKMTFRSHIEPPIKTYEYFVFLQKE